MADYYPLIARAVAGLDPNASGESRRALYERARTALIAQLRGVQPPLTEAEITRERLALEEAVRKVEAEAAHRMRGESHRSEPPRGRPDAPTREGPRRGDILRDSARAASQANRSARKTFANVSSPTPEFDRSEPDMEQRGAYHGYPDDESYDELTDQDAAPAKGRRGGYDRPEKMRSGFPLKGVLIAGLALILIGGGILGY